ncbi:MAG: sulfite exporter TauE/SafE family protein, partial [Methylosarcina sp.]
PWSCWMGMMPGTFIVVENKMPSESIEAADVPPAEEDAPAQETDHAQPLIREYQAMWQRFISFLKDRFPAS